MSGLEAFEWDGIHIRKNNSLIETGEWPFTSYTYFAFRTQNLTDCDQGKKFVSFIEWIMQQSFVQPKIEQSGHSIVPTVMMVKFTSRVFGLSLLSQKS